jgi:hypothetical protein
MKHLSTNDSLFGCLRGAAFQQLLGNVSEETAAFIATAKEVTIEDSRKFLSDDSGLLWRESYMICQRRHPQSPSFRQYSTQNDIASIFLILKRTMMYETV